jgi:hypothetical protein
VCDSDEKVAFTSLTCGYRRETLIVDGYGFAAPDVPVPGMLTVPALLNTPTAGLAVAAGDATA